MNPTWRADGTTLVQAYADVKQLWDLLDLHTRGYRASLDLAVEIPDDIYRKLNGDLKQHFRPMTPEWRARLDKASELEDVGR